jgi:hypothetical protein
MTILHRVGDGIRGERIICEAHKIEEPQLFRMTGMHRGQRNVVKGNATCIIDRELQNLGGKL